MKHKEQNPHIETNGCLKDWTKELQKNKDTKIPKTPTSCWIQEKSLSGVGGGWGVTFVSVELKTVIVYHCFSVWTMGFSAHV